MQKLLIPFDGSDNAARALDYALRLAKRTSTQLHVVTVHPESVVYGEIQVYVSKEKMDELQRKHCEDILQSARDAARAAGVPVTSEILTGDTAAAIVARAEALGCDSIVMGTRGMGAVGNLVMGSVATKVVHLTSLPVTLVK